MVFNRWHGAGSCLGLRRGQVGRSERGSWNKTPAKRKKKKESPLTSRWIYVWANSQNTCLYLCHGNFCGFAHSVFKCRRKRWCSQTPACVCKHTHTNPALTTSPLAPREKSLETCLCVLFLVSVCLGGVVGVSSVFRALLCSVALCLCLQLRAMYIS